MAQEKGFAATYYADGAFGNNIDSAVSIGFNTYHSLCWYGYWKGEKTAEGKVDEKAWRDRARVCLARAAPLFKHIYVGLAMDQDRYCTIDALNANLALYEPYRDQIIAIDLADEPGTKPKQAAWTRQHTKAMLGKVRGVLADRGWPRIDLGIGYTTTQSLEEDSITIPPPSAGGKGPDFVALECYTRPNLGRELNRKIVQGRIFAARARLHEKQKVVYILQCFDRNGAWNPTAPDKGEQDLAYLIKDSYKLGEGSDRTIGYTCFSHGRKGGALEYPKVQAQQRWFIERMKSEGIYL